MERRTKFNEIVEHSHDVVAYADGRVTLLGGLGGEELMRRQAEVYMGVLCTVGRGVLRLGSGDVEVGSGQLLVCHPKQFFESVELGRDFRSLGMVFSPDYFEKFLLIGGNRWSTKRVLETYPVVRLSAEDAEGVRRDMEYLQGRAAGLRGAHADEALDMHIKAVLMCCYDAIMRAVGEKTGVAVYQSAEQIVSRFIDLAEEMTPRTREVAAYARMMCVTAKYLSTVCKSQTGMTARQIISQKVIRKLSRMFGDPVLSVKDIAELSGFKNLSFFGKYVKREMGMSPRKVRREALGGK